MDIRDKFDTSRSRRRIGEGLYSFIDSSNFDSHWDEADKEIPLLKLQQGEEFLSAALTDLKQANFVLDAGCGDGVHSQVLKKLNIQSTTYCFLDLSESALLKAQSRAPANSIFVQGDVCSLPFRDNSFDVTFSYGVIAYSDEPQKAFRELLRVTRSGGLIGFWILPKPQGFGGLVFSFLRSAYKVLNIIGLGFLLVHLMVPIWGFLPTKSGLALWNSSYKAVKEVVSVNISPKQLSVLEADEIMSWVDRTVVEVEKNDVNEKVTLWLRKI